MADEREFDLECQARFLSRGATDLTPNPPPILLAMYCVTVSACGGDGGDGRGGQFFRRDLQLICLSRRIPSVEEFEGEVQAIVKERNELRIKVEWQFSIAQAREKLSRHYEKVKPKN